MIDSHSTQEDFRAEITVADHFLSQEVFTIARGEKTGLRRTTPIPADLARYYDSDEYLSHGDDKKGLFAAAYRFAKSYNLQWKLDVVQSLHREGHVLDYGCGIGDFIDRLAVVGYTVTGAEPDLDARNKVPEHIQDRVTTPEYVLLRDVQYDIISLWHVLEHTHDPLDTLTQLKSKLAPGGHFLIAVPNPASLDAKHYGEHWAAWDVPRHLWHFEASHIEQLAQQTGLRLKRIRPMYLDVFYVSLLSERYRKGHPILGLIRSLYWNIRVLLGKKTHCSSLLYILEAV